MHDLNHECSNIGEIVTNIDFLYSFMSVGVKLNTIYHVHCACGNMEESANPVIKIFISMFFLFVFFMEQVERNYDCEWFILHHHVRWCECKTAHTPHTHIVQEDNKVIYEVI